MSYIVGSSGRLWDKVGQKSLNWDNEEQDCFVELMRFRGINAVNIDAKARMSISARYRTRLAEEAANQLIVTIDTDSPCLLLYPLPEWEKIEANIVALPSFNHDARRIQRLLLGHATELLIDNQGRVLLPALLRDHAQLDKQVILVGQGKKFEIWSTPLWENQRQLWLENSMNSSTELPIELQNLLL